jgi:lipopolysaccharide transport system ATP-binding protein
MAGLAVHAVGLGKQYRVGQLESGYETLREQLSTLGRRAVRRRRPRRPKELFWALRDVSFEIEPGEVIGVIGRNGAGKTTLLRILSRITEPTEGYVDVRGRLGSLLEVGTGFHQELTGRENVFLNGAILGMRRREILRRFDEIVDFAGVHRFIDTPVKRYSSGMYVRLAFAVAAHLEPDILVVDEVLAVGDAEFQKKSLGKMEEIGASGRTVIFVSHNMATVARLCSRAIMLDAGRIAAHGPTDSVIAQYLLSGGETAARRSWDDPASAPGDAVARARHVAVVDTEGRDVDVVDLRETVGIELSFDVLPAAPAMTPMLALYNDQGVHVFNALDPDERWSRPREPGTYTTRAWIPANLLNEGTYVVTAFVNTIKAGYLQRHIHVPEAVSFRVVNRVAGPSAKGEVAGTWGGAVSPLLEWSTGVEEGERVGEAVRR